MRESPGLDVLAAWRGATAGVGGRMEDCCTILRWVFAGSECLLG